MRKILQWITFNLISIAAFASGHTVTISQTNVLCNGDCNGTASAIVSGGIGPFVYSWSNGSTGITATGLCAATYSCTVTDTNDLSGATASVTITQPSEIIVSTSGTCAVCNQNNGNVSVVSSGGLPPLSFVWNNGTTTTFASGLSSGVYAVTVIDANNCSKSSSAVISHCSPPLPLAYVSKEILCTGGTGAIEVRIAGGTYVSPYTYNWSNGINSITNSLTSEILNISAGSYSVSITDNVGCKFVSVVLLTEPLPIDITFTINANACKTNGASISANINGGTGVYTYTWSDGSSGITASNLGCSTYTLSVTDANGCIATTAVVVSDVIGINELNNEIDYIIYPNPATNSITIEATTNKPYIIQLTNLLGETIFNTQESATNKIIIDVGILPKGIYIVQILDKENNTRARQRLIIQ